MSLRPPDSHGWGRDHIDGEELWNVFAGQHKKQEQYRQALLRNWWECYKVRLECQMDCSGIRWVSTTYKWIFRCMAFLYLYATNGYSVLDFHLAQRQWHWVTQYSLQITIMINATQGNSEHTQSTPRASQVPQLPWMSVGFPMPQKVGNWETMADSGRKFHCSSNILG